MHNRGEKERRNSQQGQKLMDPRKSSQPPVVFHSSPAQQTRAPPTPGGSVQTSPIAEPRVSEEFCEAIPPRENYGLDCGYTIRVPSLYNSRDNTQMNVLDGRGETILRAVLEKFPEQKNNASGQLKPHEIMVLYGGSSERGEHNQELAFCAMGPKEDGFWKSEIYQRDAPGKDTLYGTVRQDNIQKVPETSEQGQFFRLVSSVEDSSKGFSGHSSAKEDNLLSATIVKGAHNPRQRDMHVYDGNGKIAAKVLPSKSRPGEYYEVGCYPGADVGMVVLAIMSIDRLLTQRGSMGQPPRRSSDNAACMIPTSINTGKIIEQGTERVLIPLIIET